MMGDGERMENGDHADLRLPRASKETCGMVVFKIGQNRMRKSSSFDNTIEVSRVYPSIYWLLGSLLGVLFAKDK